MGPILRAHMLGSVGCNLTTSRRTTERTSHEWIGSSGGWGGCVTLWGYIIDERVVIRPPFELDEELDSRGISATGWMSFGKYCTIRFYFVLIIGRHPFFQI